VAFLTLKSKEQLPTCCAGILPCYKWRCSCRASNFRF